MESIDWPIEVAYPGWLLYDGQYPDLTQGGQLEAALTFVSQGPIETVPPALPRISHTGTGYAVTALVLRAEPFVVLDLGGLTVLRWSDEPNQNAYVAGATVTANLLLGLDPDPDSPWSIQAADEYSTRQTWLVESIRLRPHSGGHRTIDSATEGTVDSLDLLILQLRPLGRRE
jgi:hypothetical protein